MISSCFYSLLLQGVVAWICCSFTADGAKCSISKLAVLVRSHNAGLKIDGGWQPEATPAGEDSSNHVNNRLSEHYIQLQCSTSTNNISHSKLPLWMHRHRRFLPQSRIWSVICSSNQGDIFTPQFDEDRGRLNCQSSFQRGCDDASSCIQVELMLIWCQTLVFSSAKISDSIHFVFLFFFTIL